MGDGVEEHPDGFVCPISQVLMEDPVILSDGHTYDRKCIVKWLEEHDTSPLTNEQLTNKEVRPNYALKSAIEDYLKRQVKPEAKTGYWVNWLRQLELEQYAASFEENGFDSKRAIQKLTDDDFKKMNVKDGHRKVMMDQIELDRERSTSSASSSSSSLLSSTTKEVKTSAHGGSGGTPFSSPRGVIQTISVRHGQCSKFGHFIQLLELTIGGKTVTYGSGVFPGKTETISLRSEEYINRVSIRSGKFLDWISFQTNQGRSFSCGGDGGELHEFSAPGETKLIAIAGRAGSWLDQISFIWK